MRAGLVAVLLLAALTRAGMDWIATAGQGYAFQLTSIGTVLGRTWPESFTDFVAGGRRSSIPFVWDPFAESLLRLPLALVISLLAALILIDRFRPRAGARAR